MTFRQPMPEVVEKFNDLIYEMKKQKSQAEEDKMLLALMVNFSSCYEKANKQNATSKTYQNEVATRETIALIYELNDLRNQIREPSQSYKSAVNNATQSCQADNATPEMKQALPYIRELSNTAKMTYKSAVELTSSIIDTGELLADRTHRGLYGSTYTGPVPQIRKIIHHSNAALKDPTVKTVSQLAVTIKNEALPMVMIKNTKFSVTSKEHSLWTKFMGCATSLSGLAAVVAGITLAATLAAGTVATFGIAPAVVIAGFALLKIGDAILNSKPTTTTTIQNADAFAQQATQLSTSIDNFTQRAKEASVALQDVNVEVSSNRSMRR